MADPTSRTQRYLACVSDPSRFRLLLVLIEGERCVTDLARAVGLSQSCTTRHLQVLTREGIVESHREGKRVMIRLVLESGTLNPALRWALGGDVGENRENVPRSGASSAEVPFELPRRSSERREPESTEGRPARRRRKETRPRRTVVRARVAGEIAVIGEALAAHELGWQSSDEPAAGLVIAPAVSDDGPADQPEEEQAHPRVSRRSEIEEFLL